MIHKSENPLLLQWRKDEGQRLKEARIAKGLSTTQLAAMVGVTAPTVVKWENGQSWPMDRLMPGKWAKAVGL